jgi:hypothetical protein
LNIASIACFPKNLSKPTNCFCPKSVARLDRWN